MKQYLDLLKEVYEKGVYKAPARAGMPATREINSCMMKFDLSEGFPLLTTKKMFFKGIKAELFWFLSGSTNIRDLWKYDCHIWDKDAFKFYNRIFQGYPVEFEEWKRRVDVGATCGVYTYGDCGKIYGHQWTNFEGKFNQIQNLIKSIKENQDSRYHIVTSWNPVDFLMYKQEAALPACHMMFQVFAREGYLDLIMYQRSCDTFLGVPFNIASYALLLQLLCKELGYLPGIFTWVGGSVHIYENHLDAVREQLTRTPLQLPTLEFMRDCSIFEMTPDDVKLVNYNSYNKIEAPLSVGV
jgi:thymidylate synthase